MTRNEYQSTSTVAWDKTGTKDGSVNLREWKKTGGSEEVFKKHAGSDGKLDRTEFQSADIDRKLGSAFDWVGLEHSGKIDAKAWKDAGLDPEVFKKHAGSDGILSFDEYNGISHEERTTADWRKANTDNSSSISLKEWKKTGGSEEIFNKYAGSNEFLGQKEFHDANLQRKKGSQSSAPSFDSLAGKDKKVSYKEWTNAGLDPADFDANVPRTKDGARGEMTRDEYQSTSTVAWDKTGRSEERRVGKEWREMGGSEEG